MFGLGWGEIAVVGLVGLIVLGPDRLPHYAREAGKMLRQLRTMANNATAEIKAELGPELADLDVRDLHPKAMLRKYMEAEDPADTATATAHYPTAVPPESAAEPVKATERYEDVT